MGNRWLQIAIVVCWTASMSWLVVEKVLPLVGAGNRPDLAKNIPQETEQPVSVCWELRWNDRTIGEASTCARRQPGGAVQVQSELRLEHLPWQQMLSELLGSVGTLIRPLVGGEPEEEFDLAVESHMSYDPAHRLEAFVSAVQLGDYQDFIVLQGKVTANRLKLSVQTAGESIAGRPPAMQELYSNEFDLPADALVTDALAPQGHLQNLKVGQSWTFSVYRPFPPNSPLQFIQAKVERQEVIRWNGELVQVFEVIYRDEAGTGITAAREPIGRLWVAPDGAVLQQEIRFAKFRLTFVRVPDEQCRAAACWDGNTP